MARSCSAVSSISPSFFGRDNSTWPRLFLLSPFYHSRPKRRLPEGSSRSRELHVLEAESHEGPDEADTWSTGNGHARGQARIIPRIRLASRQHWPTPTSKPRRTSCAGCVAVNGRDAGDHRSRLRGTALARELARLILGVLLETPGLPKHAGGIGGRNRNREA